MGRKDLPWRCSSSGKSHAVVNFWEPCVEGLYADTLCGQNIRHFDVPVGREDPRACWTCTRMVDSEEEEAR